MPLCVMVTDNQGRPVYWNESMLAYTRVAAPDGVSSRDQPPRQRRYTF